MVTYKLYSWDRMAKRFKLVSSIIDHIDDNPIDIDVAVEMWMAILKTNDHTRWELDCVSDQTTIIRAKHETFVVTDRDETPTWDWVS